VLWRGLRRLEAMGKGWLLALQASPLYEETELQVGTNSLEIAKELPQNNISLSAILSYAAPYGQPKLERLVPESVGHPQ
jgi:hypothetical protein